MRCGVGLFWRPSWIASRSVAPLSSVRLVGLIVLLSSVGCAAASPNPRALHYVEEELVYSRPGTAASYDAYLRARIALSADPPQVEVADQEIQRALRFDPRDPHLWTTMAEVASAAGDDERALTAARRALSLRPGYGPAQRMVARIEGGAAAASVD